MIESIKCVLKDSNDKSLIVEADDPRKIGLILEEADLVRLQIGEETVVVNGNDIINAVKRCMVRNYL